ncbi:MAG TPA: hypothetical protein VMF55_12050 [Solirubrobacterales bacterium]|nr:hypothetical protein [Solirubrobacterales bacterium]
MSRRNLWRGTAILACVVASTAVVVASAAAKPKPPFAPQTGSYTGTLTTEGQSQAESAQVAKKGKKYSVVLTISAFAECSTQIGPDSVPLVVSNLTVPVKGKALAFSGTVPPAGGSGLGEVLVKVDGRFTGPTAFTATAGIEVPAGTLQCTVAPISMKLKRS